MIEPTLSVIVFVILIISAIYIKNKYNNYIDQYKNYEIYTIDLYKNIINDWDIVYELEERLSKEE